MTMETDGPPKVLVWFRVYAVLMALMYLVVVVVGPLAIAFSDHAGSSMERQEALIIGMICVVIGLPMLGLYMITIFMPRKPWAWMVGIIAIGIGMTSACCLPAAIPLLIYWLKPDVKRHFNFG